MLKRILIALLVSMSVAYGQFVDTSSSSIREDKNEVINYNNHQGNDVISGPLTLNIQWQGQPKDLQVDLKHNGTTYNVPVGLTGYSDSITVHGINVFEGDRWSGDWQLRIRSDEDFTITEWSVVPEPTSTALAVGLGLLGFTIFRRKYAKS